MAALDELHSLRTAVLIGAKSSAADGLIRSVALPRKADSSTSQRACLVGCPQQRHHYRLPQHAQIAADILLNMCEAARPCARSPMPTSQDSICVRGSSAVVRVCHWSTFQARKSVSSFEHRSDDCRSLRSWSQDGSQ